MDRQTLTDQHKAAVTRYARAIGDDGQVPDGLLAELAVIADAHAADVAHNERAADAWPPVGKPVRKASHVVSADELRALIEQGALTNDEDARVREVLGMDAAPAESAPAPQELHPAESAPPRRRRAAAK